MAHSKWMRCSVEIIYCRLIASQMRFYCCVKFRKSVAWKMGYGVGGGLVVEFGKSNEISAYLVSENFLRTAFDLVRAVI